MEAALEHGVPVFVEKPLCDDAARAVGLSELGGDRLFVMDKWRYHPGVLELAAIARSGRLGSVLGLSTTRVGWGQKHDDVDSAWILAPHDLTIALEILGRVPQPVWAVGLRLGERRPAPGGDARRGAGMARPRRVVADAASIDARWTLLCADGTASLAGGWDTHVTIVRRGRRPPTASASKRQASCPCLAELRMFVEHLGGGPPPKSSAAEGAEVVAVIERAAKPRPVAVIDATILIPTYRHAALLPYAVESALAQEGASIELFVVGDGVEDDTRAALEPFLADPRVRFFDLPKGERHGELNRHAALAEATGRIVCYLSDDDLLLPCHVATMLELLEDADLAHSAPFMMEPGDVLAYVPFDLSQEPQQARLRRGDWNAIGLTGTAHTLAAYRRLPRGWRPAPIGSSTDLHMWQQFLDLPDFRGVTGTDLTHLHFPSLHLGRSVRSRNAGRRSSRGCRDSRSCGPSGLALRAHRTSTETAAAVGLRGRRPQNAMLSQCQLDEPPGRRPDRSPNATAIAELRAARPWNRPGPGGCATVCSRSGRCERSPHGCPQLAERSQRLVPWRQERLLARPVDPEPGLVPAAAELVGRIPLVIDGVDVERRLVEVEAVRTPVGTTRQAGRSDAQLDRRGQPLGRRAFAQVVQPDRGAARDHGQVVRVPPVRMDASEHVRDRADGVPLGRLDLRATTSRGRAR